jgi:hypothetical protein
MSNVTYASMHAHVFVPGMGQVGPTLSNVQNAGIKATKMTLKETTILLEVVEKGKTYKVEVPHSNFICWTVE